MCIGVPPSWPTSTLLQNSVSDGQPPASLYQSAGFSGQPPTDSAVALPRAIARLLWTFPNSKVSTIPIGGLSCSETQYRIRLYRLSIGNPRYRIQPDSCIRNPTPSLW